MIAAKKLMMARSLPFIRPTRWEQTSTDTGVDIAPANTSFLCDGRASITSLTGYGNFSAITAYFDRLISFREVYIGAASASTGLAIRDSRGIFQMRQDGIWLNQWNYGPVMSELGKIIAFKWSAIDVRVCDAIRVIKDSNNDRIAVSELRVR